MTETIYLLSNEEKYMLRRVCRGRILLLFVFVLPAFLGCLLVLGHGLSNFSSRDFNLPSLLFLLFFVSLPCLMGWYFIPLYRETFRYRLATHKQVVDTRVLRVIKWYANMNYRFIISTEYRSLHSGMQVILMPGLQYGDLQQGDHIRLHLLHNSKMDIIRIERL
ncbi:hypothetical protein GCM10027051_13710 [Niabella terrae]